MDREDIVDDLEAFDRSALYQTVHSIRLLSLRQLSWFAVSALIVFAWPLVAGVNRWTVIGPPLDVKAMAVDPSNPQILYAATFAAVARSDERGLRWTVIPVPDLLQPSAIRVAPSAPSILYLATMNAVHRSSDAGTTWTRRDAPKANQFLNDLQVDPSNANTVVVACSNFCFFGCSGGGVFRSDNGGQTWKAAGLKDKNVRHIALAGRASDVMYAATESQVFRTANRGASWAEVSPVGTGEIDGIVVDPEIPTTVYISATLGIYRSNTLGATWEMIRGADYGTSIAAAGDGSHQLCASGAGPALSVDHGTTWRELPIAGSNLAFNGLRDVVASRDTCFALSNLLGMSGGQILAYDVPRPKRRAVVP